MKVNLSKMLRSALALLLAFSMVVGYVPTVAFAAPYVGTLNYVSIGDSMTNGYGFVGYNQDQHTEGYDFFQDQMVYGTDAYPLQFEEYLEEQNPGFQVNHTKLALSGLRAEDVAFLLDMADEPVDGYFETSWSYAWNGGCSFVEGTSNGCVYYNYHKTQCADTIAAQLAYMKNYYQTSMKNADVISLALGNASFNAYFIDCMMRVLGAMGADWDEIDRPEVELEDALAMLSREEDKEMVMKAYNGFKTKLLAAVPSEMAEQFKVGELCDLVAYITASFMVHYKLVIQWIAENNPDAKVILVGVLNSNAGMTVTGDGINLDLGALMDEVYGYVSAYVAAVPTEMQLSGQGQDLEFYFVQQPENPEMIATMVDELAAANWGQVDRVDGATVRTKTKTAYDEILKGMLDGMAPGISNGTMNALPDAAHDIIYAALEIAIVESLKSGEIDLNAVATFAGGLETVFADAPADQLAGVLTGQVTTVQATVAFADFFCAEDMLPLVRLFAMNKVGNGISAHPTPTTHDRIADAVETAFESYTAEEETDKNLGFESNAAAKKIYSYLRSNGYLSDAQVMDIVWFAYDRLIDGELSNKDAREIIGYIWNTTLAVEKTETAAVAGSSSAGSSSGALSVEEKLEIIEEVMNILAEDEGVKGAYPEIESVVELYEKLAVEDENGKQLIPDDVLIELFDKVMLTVGDTEGTPEITDEVITNLTTDITDTILTDERIAPEDRVLILEAVAGSLGGMVGGESTEALAPHMEAMNALRARLNASGLLTAEQEGEIVSQVAAMLPAVMAGKQPTQDEIVAVVDGVYNIVFNREDLSVEDKIQIVLITLEVLDEYGYTDDAYAMGYETAKAAGYVAEAVKYVDIAADAIATAKKAVEVFAVEEKYEAVKAALIAELDETAATLAKIEALLAADALSTKDGALSELLKLEGDLNNHIENLKTLAMEIGFVADPYIQAAVDAHNKYAAVVTAVVEEAYKYVAGIDDTYAVIVEEIGKVADQMHPDLGAAVRKYLTEVPADALAILYAHGEEAVNVLIAKAALASGDIENIYNALAPVVEKHGKAIYEIVVDSDATADILAAIDAAYADLLKLYEQASKAPVASAMNADITAAQKYILGLYNTLYPLVMDVVAEVTEYPEYAELTGAAWTALMDLIKVGNYAGEYGAWIAGDVQIMLSEQLLALFANNDEFMQVFMPLFIENVTFVNQFLMDLTDKVTDQIWNTYLQIREVIENMIDTIIEFGKDACNQIKHQLNVLCNNIKDALNEQVNNLKDLVNDLLEKAEDMAKEQLKQVLDLVNQLIAQIEKQLDTLEGIAKEKLQAVYDALLNLRDAINQALSDATNGAINNLMDAINALKKAVADAAAYLNAEAMELINKIVEIIEALYWNATHDYYMVDEASYYVAIGDGTAVSEESYVEKLAEELGVAYNNLAVKGMLVADTYELLEKEAAEIAKADLITVGFGSNSFVNYAIDNIGAGILTGSFAEHDWASAVGAEGVTYVEEILAAIYAELEAQGLGTFEYGPIKADMAQLLTAAIESYAYAAISYATELPEVIDEIHAINPNAVVAIVGMYNPNADMVLDLGETAFDIGEYVDYLVTAANVHNFTYALLTDKAIFVEADEVETVNTETTMDIGAFLVHYMDGYGVVKTGEVMNPSEAGHEYIKTQIREALVLVNPVEIEMTRMILGNELAMQFAFKKAAIIEGVPYEVVITKTYADGRENKVVEIPVSEWKSATIDGEAYYYVSFNGIAAKEMSDDVNVQIVVADKLAVSKVYTDSIRVYANRQLDKAEEAVIKGLYVDMLNYGAAAQTYFGYDAQNLANAELTAEEQGYATKEVKLENKLVAGKNYNASQLNLASSIQLRVKFDNIDASMKAVVSFTNHTGREIEVEVAGSEFIGNGTVVVVDEIVAADYAQDVTIVVYDAAGNKVAEAVDSVASYIARMSDKSATPAIYDAVAKYDAAAYAYLHK